MNNAIATRDDIEVMTWKADMLIKSGLLPQHIKNANQIIAIDMMARELNIPTWQAINGINVIQGKPTVSPQLMLALIERSGLMEDIKIDGDSARCEVMMKRRGRTPHTESFGMVEATAMNLAIKDNYKKQPAVMLKWRAVAACARVVFPDVLMGMYTTEEIAPDDVQVNAEGEMEIITIDALPQASTNGTRPPAPAPAPTSPPSQNGAHDGKTIAFPGDQPATPKNTPPQDSAPTAGQMRIEVLTEIQASAYTVGKKSGVRFLTPLGSVSYTRDPFRQAGFIVTDQSWTEPGVYDLGGEYNVVSTYTVGKKQGSLSYWEITSVAKRELERFPAPEGAKDIPF